MPSELKSISERRSPNPEGMVMEGEKKKKAGNSTGAIGLVRLLIATTQPWESDRRWKEAHSTDDDCEQSGIKTNTATWLLNTFSPLSFFFKLHLRA